MFFTDTHTHLYLNAFDDDRTETIERALEQDIKECCYQTLTVHPLMVC